MTEDEEEALERWQILMALVKGARRIIAVSAEHGCALTRAEAMQLDAVLEEIDTEFAKATG